MAIQENIAKKSLVLMVEKGLKGDGSPLLKSRTYSNVKADASAENILAVGKAISGLMQDTVQKVIVSQKVELEEM